MDSIYRLLTLNKNAANSAFERLKRIKGLKCVITLPIRSAQPYKQYEPGQFGSIFGEEDKLEHDNEESYVDTLLLFNLFKEGYSGTGEFDAFNSEAYCLTREKDRLPKGTDIEVNFYGRKMYFKVDDHKNLTPTVTEQLFVKNILVPAT